MAEQAMQALLLRYFAAEKQESLLFVAAGLAALVAAALLLRGGGPRYQAVEIALLAAGIGLCPAFPRRQGWYAAGIGLLVQAALMLVLDLFAGKRGRDYLDAIARLGGAP